MHSILLKKKKKKKEKKKQKVFAHSVTALRFYSAVLSVKKTPLHVPCVRARIHTGPSPRGTERQRQQEPRRGQTPAAHPVPLPVSFYRSPR